MDGATFTATKGGTRKGHACPLLGGHGSPPATAALYSSRVRRKASRGTPRSASLSASSLRLTASITVPPVLFAISTISFAVRALVGVAFAAGVDSYGVAPVELGDLHEPFRGEISGGSGQVAAVELVETCAGECALLQRRPKTVAR